MSGRVPGAATAPIATSELLPRLPAAQDPPFLIGVIDTGISVVAQRPHPYLEGHLADGWEAQPDAGTDDSSFTEDGHGTFVSAVILSHAPTATIAMRNGLDMTDPLKQDARVVRHLRDLREVPALRLVNLSFFGKDEPVGPDSIRQALADLFAVRPDLVVVVGAGNRWTDAPTFPAAFNRVFPEQVISVGAVDEWVLERYSVQEGGSMSHWPPRAAFSNHGDWVDVYADGAMVLGPRLQDGEHAWCRWSGTSFAAAAVTGMIAATMIELGVDARAAWRRRRDTRVRPGDGERSIDGRPYLPSAR